MLKEVCLVTLMVCLASCERIYNQGDRSPTFDRDQEERVRGSSAAGSRDRDSESPTRSSYLDRFTTERPAGAYAGSPYDRQRENSWDSGSVTHRRPSYVTDRYGDVVAAGAVTSRPYGYVTMYTTSSWRDRDSVTHGSSWDRRTASPWGSSSGGSISGPLGSSGSISGPSVRNRDRFDSNDAYVRIQFELVNLQNDKGLNIDGGKCDTFGSCDTVCYAYIDTDRPNAEFPGARELQYFTKVFQTDDNNSPAFTRANVTREVCGSPYREAVGRVYCEDNDPLSKADMINKWDCPINREPEGSETYASWTSGECRTRFQADKMKLHYRYKIYSIPRARCDSSIGNLPLSAGGTTRRRS